VILALFLAVAALAFYLQSSGFGFIALDDEVYTTNNPLVKNGFTAEAVKGAVSGVYQFYWIPATWLSMMADVAISGPGPGGFHRTNAILHALNTLLFFTLLYRATGSPWKSFLAAALWAFHPLRVEAVAWVTARKDLLSGFFFLLCLLSYLEYAKKGGWKWYAGSLAALIFGLASKPILVVAPLLLLAFDFWPLERFKGGGAQDLKKNALEKAPFFALAGVFSLSTLINQSDAITGESLPLASRLSDVATSYLFYLWKTLWPAGLVISNRESALHLTGFPAFLAGLFLIGATFAAFWYRKKLPPVLSGWLWYLCALIPLCGIVPVGINFTADRFTYIPAMGLSFLAVWGVDGLAGENPKLRRSLITLAVAVITPLAVTANMQLARWKSSETLFTYFYEQSPSPFSKKLLSAARFEAGNYPEAEKLLREALEQEPHDKQALMNMGLILEKQGKNSEAAPYFQKASSLSKDSTPETAELAIFTALQRKDYKEVMRLAGEALTKDPSNPSANLFMGQAAYALGQYDLSEEHLKKAVSLKKNYLPALLSYAALLQKRGKDAEALENFEAVLASAPDHLAAAYQAALLWVKKGDHAKAIERFQLVAGRASNPEVSLGIALSAAKLGRDALAAEHFRKYLAAVPGDATARLGLGDTLARLGAQEDAAKAFREVLSGNPNDRGASEGLKRLGVR
jgi:tetratricopeptide (TPR) repeat protein